MSVLVVGELMKIIFFIDQVVMVCGIMFWLRLVSMLISLIGRLVCLLRCVMVSDENGVSFEGLSSIVLLVVSVGLSCQLQVKVGVFYGVICSIVL